MIGSVTNVHNEEELLMGFLHLMDVDLRVIIISDYTYSGKLVKHDNSEKIALRNNKVIVIRTREYNQSIMRNLGLSLLQGEGIEYTFIADADEWYPRETLENYKRFINDTKALAYRTKMLYSFRKPEYHAVAPKDGGTIIAMRTDLRLDPNEKRDWKGEVVDIPENLGKVHHFSYVRSPKKIKEKIKSFSHAHEVRPNWYKEVFLPFTPDMKNFAPTNPYDFTECRIINLPEEIKEQWQSIQL